jgi:hypothetical protein
MVVLEAMPPLIVAVVVAEDLIQDQIGQPMDLVVAAVEEPFT